MPQPEYSQVSRGVAAGLFAFVSKYFADMSAHQHEKWRFSPKLPTSFGATRGEGQGCRRIDGRICTTADHPKEIARHSLMGAPVAKQIITLKKTLRQPSPGHRSSLLRPCVSICLSSYFTGEFGSSIFTESRYERSSQISSSLPASSESRDWGSAE